MPISSKSNERIKEIRALRHRKERERTGLFFVEGIRIVAEAADLGAHIETLVLAPDLLESEFARDLVQRLHARGVPILEVTGEVFKSVSLKQGPQGIGAVLQQRLRRLSEVRAGKGHCWVALEGVADPGNLGTILRTADAVGSSGVILVGATTDPYDPEAVRASMGAVFAQSVARATLPELAAWKREQGCFLVGTSDAAGADYRDIAYPRPVVLFMGSEREGLSEDAVALTDMMVQIPMVGRSDSLNLAVATGVMLYEIFNQRQGRFPLNT
jgi:RNA methyltransferase, TrmH family